MKIRNNGGVLGPKNAGSPSYASGMWSIQELAQNQRDGLWPYASNPNADLNYGQTSLLLHGDGTNGGQNQTFLDSSTNAFTVTRNGNATQGSFSPFSQPDGYWSNYFNYPTTTDYVSTPSSATFNFSSGNWTIEAWFFPQSHLSGSARYFTLNGAYGLIPGGTSNALIWNNFGSSSPLTTTYIPALNQWQHIALVNNSGTTTIYINGVSYGSAATFMPNTNASITIGGCGGTYAYGFQGYVSNFRVLVGTALYTSNFTPSTSPLTAITNTALLTCQSNRFKDNSTNAFTITPSGSPQIQLFCPLSSPTPYVKATNGGSGYFDGSGDYLNTSVSAIGTGDFTIEYWSYLNALNGAGQPGYFQISDTVGGLKTTYTTGVLALDNTVLYVNVGGTTIATTYTLTKYQWFHTAIVRSSGTVSVYVNGVLVSTPTSITTNLTGTYLAIGGYYSTSYLIPGGYISDFRVITGTALYTTTFTPPTAPLTAISNTKFLCNFTNAGILDNTGLNDLETVGNAQISTTQNKFGGTSMYFPGTAGSYLNVPASPNLSFEGGDFTIECWVYFNALGAQGSYNPAIISYGGSSWNFDFAVDGNGSIFLYVGVSYIIQSANGQITTGSWIHIALVRSGNNFTIYKNGVSIASATSSSSFSLSGISPKIGAVDASNGAINAYIDDLRITKGYARYLYNFTPPTLSYPNNGYSLYTPPTTDSYFGSTALLLHGDGSSGAQNNTFLDGSTNAFTITRNGNTTQGTFTPFSRAEGYWDNYFDGSSAYYAAGTGSATPFTFGTSTDFTIEGWFYSNVTSGDTNYRTIISSYDNRTANYGCIVSLYTTGTPVLQGYFNTISINGTTTLQAGVWYNFAFTRSGSNYYLFLNGVLQGTASGSVTADNNSNWYIGKLPYASQTGYFNGYISNLRVVKGTALYTANYTPSTAPLTAISGTSLLTCQSNRFKDNSTNAYAMTVSNGTPQVQTFIPFEPTAPYSAVNNGGGMYFDGSGDQLNAPVAAISSVGSSDFSFECWIYVLKQTNTYAQGLISYGPAGVTSTTSCISFQLSNTGYLLIAYAAGDSALLTDPNLMTLNQWNHCVVCRSGSTISLFKNGTRVATTTTSATVGSSGDTLAIGGQWYANDTTRQLQGYMSGVRIVKGSSAYDATQTTLTVPTSPLTAITNTQLLLSGTNAGIIDSAASNNLETVGTAQVLSNQYKFGTGSMYFDGAGTAYLFVDAPSTSTFAFGTGDFTIEFWIYRNASGVQHDIIAFNPTSTNGAYPAIYIGSDNNLYYYTQSANRITGTSISTSTWYHVALVRYNSVTKLYINGNQVGSSYADTNSYLCGASRPVIGSAGYGLNGTYNGYIDDLRITKGICRYPYNFTIPASAYPNN